MTVSSINSNIAAFAAQASINIAQNAITESVARLSSGNAIVNASDNVAALSIGTDLQTQVSTLKIAQQNTSLGTSLLQVADGALAQIQSILQQQSSLAAQANSGSLSDTQRGFLQQQFSSLTDQIDNLVSGTNFNGVTLLDGSLSQQAALGDTTTQATAGQSTLTFTNNVGTHDTVIINGVTLTEGTTSSYDFASGDTIAQTVANLATVLNNPSSDTNLSAADRLAIGQAIYSAQGNTLTITSRTGGTLGGAVTVDMSGTATAGGNAGVGGQFGGSYSNMFSTGFTSASATIIAASAGVATADIPFVEGQAITATIGSGSSTTLYTTTSTDKSLQDIVNGINSNSAGTGVTATLTYNPTSASPYNIRLNYASDAAAITIGAGSHYVNTTHGLENSTGTFNMFTSASGSPFTAASTVAVAAAATVAAPFQGGDALKITLSGNTGSPITLISSMTTGATISGLVTAINANSDTTGVHATLVGSAGSGFNIALAFNDATQAQIASVNGGTHFYNLNAETHVLNNSADSYNVFTTPLTGKTSVATKTAATTHVPTSTAPFRAGDTVSITVGGHSVSATVPAMASSTVAVSLSDIADALNATANAHTFGVHVAVVGSAGSGYNLDVTYADAGATTAAPTDVTFTPGANYSFAKGSAINAATTTTFAAVTPSYVSAATNQTVYGLAGGANNGLGLGNTTATGSVGDNILTSLAQSHAQVSITFPNIAAADLTSSDGFGTAGAVYINVGGHNFAFTTTTAANKAPDEITIGSTLAETLDNAVSTINSYYANGDATGDEGYQLNQIQVSRDGNSLDFTGKDLSPVTTATGGTSTVAITGFSGVSASNGGALDNNGAGGVDATGVSNAAFTGTISGFAATYNSANNVTASVKVGNYTYTASAIGTNPTTGNSTVRFYSNTLSDGSNGGYFDVILQQNDGQVVANQTDADTFAQRLNAAFSSLSFNQERNVSSYSGTQTIVSNGTVTGSLVGTSVAAQLPDFNNARLDNVTVTAPSGSSTDGKISLVINGETFTTSSGIGSKLGANQTYRLVSTTNANDYVDFTTGNSTISFGSTADATALQGALDQAFGVSSSSAALSFQVGTTSSNVLKVSIQDTSSGSIFNGESIDVSTQADAAIASTVVNSALNTVTAIRASVGALESQFNYASANLSSAIQNQDSAASSLLDTDVASESTNFAEEQVKLQAGIAVLAQANQQQQNLVKLIG